MKNKVLFGQEAIESMKVGLDTVYKAVSSTLGAAGKNCVYRSDYSRNPVTTNDGVTIAKRINLEDEAASMGADYIKQAAERTNDEAGDGTTTAVVLSHAMVEKGLEIVSKGKNPMKLRKEMTEAMEGVISKLKIVATPIKTDEELFNVANVSMENPKIAQIVVDAVKRAGENGTVLVEESSGIEIEKENIEGLKFDKGYLSPYMVTNIEKMEAVLNDCLILVTDKMLSVNNDIFHLLEALHAKGVTQILIVCENIQGELLSTLIANKMKGTFNAVVVQKPFDTEMLEDIAVVSGGEVLSAAKVTKEFNAEHIVKLGKAKKIIVGKDSTIIIGGEGKKENVDARIEALKNESLATESEYKRDSLKERIAKLAGGLVLIKVGAATESDMKYMKLKVDDAVAATRAALEEGIVAGGGRALYDISLATPKNEGEEVIFYACGRPMRKIIENSGENVDEIVSNLKEGEIWNSLENEVCIDPIKNGIIDPVKVERCALKNAVSMAGTFITQGCVLVDLPKENKGDTI